MVLRVFSLGIFYICHIQVTSYTLTNLAHVILMQNLILYYRYEFTETRSAVIILCDFQLVFEGVVSNVVVV